MRASLSDSERQRLGEPRGLNRSQGGFAMALSAAKKLIKDASPEALFERMEKAAAEGNVAEFKKAFFLGAPWLDPKDPTRTALAVACLAKANSIPMLSFLQERGASALGIALRSDPKGKRSRNVLTLELAIENGNWEAARFLGPEAARAWAQYVYQRRYFDHQSENRASEWEGIPVEALHRAPSYPGAPCWIQWDDGEAREPIAGAMSALVNLLHNSRRASVKSAQAALFLRATLVDPECVRLMPGPIGRSIFSDYLLEGLGPLLAAAPFPDVLEAFLDAGVAQGPCPQTLAAANHARNIGATGSLAILWEKARTRPSPLELAPSVLGDSDRVKERVEALRQLSAASASGPKASAPSPAPAIAPAIKRRVLASASSAPKPASPRSAP